MTTHFPDIMYATHPLAPHCKVMCDGKELSHCFSADKSAGKAWCYVLGERVDEQIPTEEITGEIEYVWVD